MAGLEIVGRESELAIAGGFLDAARQRSCALVVEGEAGIGKTAVWGAVVAQALAQGHRVLRCQAEQAEARLSFVGLGDLLGDIPRKALQSLPGPQRDALEVALLREPARGRRPDPRTVSVALKSLLAHLARRGPVLIAVDDLQWLDAPTARALAFAAR